MCLGDIRFLPLIRSRIIPVNVGISYATGIPINQVRVGLFVPSFNNLIGRMVPFVEPSVIDEGFQFSNDTEASAPLKLTWAEWGDIIQAEWFFVASRIKTINVIESVVPSEVMLKIRQLGTESLDYSVR